jgi:hypothetical protein
MGSILEVSRIYKCNFYIILTCLMCFFFSFDDCINIISGSIQVDFLYQLWFLS